MLILKLQFPSCSWGIFNYTLALQTDFIPTPLKTFLLRTRKKKKKSSLPSFSSSPFHIHTDLI